MTTGPPTVEDVLSALGHALDLLIRFARRPVHGTILINGKEPNGMPIPVHKFDFAIAYSDDLGQTVPEGAPTSWSVVGLDDSPSNSATLSVDPSDDRKGTGEITADGAPSFKLRATMGPLTFESDELDPVVGAPSAGTITVTPV